jgi:hypothetical protein
MHAAKQFFLFPLPEPVFLNFQGAQASIPRNQVRQHDNPIPTRFLAPTDCLKIPAQFTVYCAFQIIVSAFPFKIIESGQDSLQRSVQSMAHPATQDAVFLCCSL